MLILRKGTSNLQADRLGIFNRSKHNAYDQNKRFWDFFCIKNFIPIQNVNQWPNSGNNLISNLIELHLQFFRNYIIHTMWWSVLTSTVLRNDKILKVCENTRRLTLKRHHKKVFFERNYGQIWTEYWLCDRKLFEDNVQNISNFRSNKNMIWDLREFCADRQFMEKG